MNTLQIRTTELKPGKPKIVVPLTGTYSAVLIHECNSALSLSCDMVEWRLDYYLSAVDDIQSRLGDEKLFAELIKCLDVMRFVLKETPIIVTFRSKEQGGMMDVDGERKRLLLQVIAQSGLADIIDVEYGDVERAMLDDETSTLIESLKVAGSSIMISHHDFTGTPTAETMVNLASRMKSLGADICKIVTMAESEEDIKTMAEATEAIVQRGADPVVGFCMGDAGKESRITCGKHGSCMTFGAMSDVVAPGMVEVHTLRQAVDQYYTE